MAKKEIVTYSQQTFENIKHIDENGAEFWYARELQTALEYTEWRNFEKSVKRAKEACTASGFVETDHFVDVNKMINLAKGAKSEVSDIKLSRYFQKMKNAWPFAMKLRFETSSLPVPQRRLVLKRLWITPYSKTVVTKAFIMGWE